MRDGRAKWKNKRGNDLELAKADRTIINSGSLDHFRDLTCLPPPVG